MPDAAEAERIRALGPFCLEFAQRFRRRQPIPVVGNVHEPAATRADKGGVVHGGSGATIGSDASLKDEVHRVVLANLAVAVSACGLGANPRPACGFALARHATTASCARSEREAASRSRATRIAEDAPSVVACGKAA